MNINSPVGYSEKFGRRVFTWHIVVIQLIFDNVDFYNYIILITVEKVLE